MFFVVTGGSGSGKSAFAEKLTASLGEGRRIYIATMMCFDEEGKKRISRHRAMRADKHFETLERYTDLCGLEVPEDSILLLECMSNLVANEMFDESGAKEGTVEAVVEGLHHLRKKARHLVVVTNEIFSDGLPSMFQYTSFFFLVFLYSTFCQCNIYLCLFVLALPFPPKAHGNGVSRLPVP